MSTSAAPRVACLHRAGTRAPARAVPRRPERASADLAARIRDHWDAASDTADLDPASVHASRETEDAWRDVYVVSLPPRPLEVLDVGCGTGGPALLLRTLGHRPRGVDVSPRAVELARARALDRGIALQFDVADTTALPFDDETFDAVHVRDTLWTLPEPERALAEWLRVLRRGGALLVLETMPSVHGPGGACARGLLTRAAVAAQRLVGRDPAVRGRPSRARHPGAASLPFLRGATPAQLGGFLSRGGVAGADARSLRWVWEAGGVPKAPTFAAAWGVRG